jgi:hypothetical protein
MSIYNYEILTKNYLPGSQKNSLTNRVAVQKRLILDILPVYLTVSVQTVGLFFVWNN